MRGGILMGTKEQYYEVTAGKLIENMKKRQMDAFYCPTAEEAARKALEFVLPGMTVSNGGSQTIEQCGILDALSKREDIIFLDRRTAGNADKHSDILHKAYFSDVYFMSSNAITLDGILVNIDGTGGRTSCLIYGPETIVIIAGMNKVCTDVEAAYKRVKNTASPPNAIRLHKNTPCAATGRCSDCQSPDCICSNTVITRRSQVPGRIKVILVGEELGF